MEMPQLKNSSPDPMMPTMMGGTPDAAMGMPSGPTGAEMPPMGSDMGQSQDALMNSETEETPTPAECATGDPKTDGLKRQLLQKMMENLLNKPGRSVNELVNGVKAVIGAYKNYSKEWDNLSGVAEAPLPPGGSNPSAGGSSSEIQAILDKIKAQKGDSGASSMPINSDSTAIPPPPPIGPMDKGPSGLGGPGYKQPAPINRLGIWGY
jgi:hypothetical protein